MSSRRKEIRLFLHNIGNDQFKIIDEKLQKSIIQREQERELKRKQNLLDIKGSLSSDINSVKNNIRRQYKSLKQNRTSKLDTAFTKPNKNSSKSQGKTQQKYQRKFKDQQNTKVTSRQSKKISNNSSEKLSSTNFNDIKQEYIKIESNKSQTNKSDSYEKNKNSNENKVIKENFFENELSSISKKDNSQQRHNFDQIIENYFVKSSSQSIEQQNNFGKKSNSKENPKKLNYDITNFFFDPEDLISDQNKVGQNSNQETDKQNEKQNKDSFETQEETNVQQNVKTNLKKEQIKTNYYEEKPLSCEIKKPNSTLKPFTVLYIGRARQQPNNNTNHSESQQKNQRVQPKKVKIEGKFKDDIPVKILRTIQENKQIYFELEWAQRKSGIQPDASFVTFDEFKENEAMSLIEFLTTQITYIDMNGNPRQIEPDLNKQEFQLLNPEKYHPEKILKIFRSSYGPTFEVEWKRLQNNKPQPSLVYYQLLKQQYPGFLLDYYRTKITFD